jgi:DNA-binding NarL/FixJ family response regulator
VVELSDQRLELSSGLVDVRPVPSAVVAHGNSDVADRQPEPHGRRRIVVAGSSLTIVEALGAALAGQAGLDVLSTAMTETELFEVISGRRPDGVVLYVPKLDMDTISVVDRLKMSDPIVRIVVLAGQPSRQALAYAAEAGVAACLSLSSRLRDVAEAIRAETTDTMLVDVTSLSVPEEPRRADVPEKALTRRELEVLTMLANGASPPAIAAQMVISIYTARGHVKSVLRKLGAHSQLEAVAVARRLGLVGYVASGAGQNEPRRPEPVPLRSIGPVSDGQLFGWRRSG